MKPTATLGNGRNKRPSCFSCFFSSPFISDSDELDPSPKTSTPRQSSTAFFLYRFRGRIRTVPLDEIPGDGRLEAASPEIGREGNRRKGFLQNFRKKRSKTTSKPLTETPNSEPQLSTICHMSTKYNFRSQKRAPLHRVQGPVQTGIRTSHPGLPKANQTAGSTRSTTRASGRVDTVLGLLILATTLTALLFFGRVFSVFWSCVWLCFLPLALPPLRPSTKLIGGEVVNVESAENKKKVVLSGLLERNI